MDKIINKLVEKEMNKKAVWIDFVISLNIPSWKLDLLKKINNRFLRKIIGADIEIINQSLIADFGTITTIKLNGKIISKRKFK